MIDFGLVKGAAIKSGIGMAFAAAAGAYEVVSHHVMGNFSTLGEAFFHVAQPTNIGIAAGLCIGLGTGIELIMRHNRRQDAEQKAKYPPERPALRR